MKIPDEAVEAFTQYRRKQIAELRPWQPGDDMSGVSVSAEDAKAGSPKSGDMIARNPKNHADQWLVAAAYFADNFEPIAAGKTTDEAVEAGTKACRDITFNALTMDECRDAVRKSLEAALPHLSQGAVSAKPLDWVELNEGKVFRALLPVIGSIRIEPYGVCGWWEVLWSMPGQCDKLIPDVFDTPDEAKAAAQADYERRILSALSPAPVGVTGEAIEKAYRQGHIDGRCGGTGPTEDDDWDRARPNLVATPVVATDEMVQKFITTSRDEDAGYRDWTEAVTAGLNATLASREPAPTDTQEGVEWQPIETAPKGSEMFLAYAPPSNDFPDGRTIIVKGSTLASMMAEGTPNHLAFPATHWMPLPVPPAAGQSNE